MATFDEIEFTKKNKALVAVNEKLKVKHCEKVLYLIILFPCNFEELVRLLDMDSSRAQLRNALRHLKKHDLIYHVKVGTSKQKGRYESTNGGKKHLKSLEAKIAI